MKGYPAAWQDSDMITMRFVCHDECNALESKTNQVSMPLKEFHRLLHVGNFMLTPMLTLLNEKGKMCFHADGCRSFAATHDTGYTAVLKIFGDTRDKLSFRYALQFISEAGAKTHRSGPISLEAFQKLCDMEGDVKEFGIRCQNVKDEYVTI